MWTTDMESAKTPLDLQSPPSVTWSCNFCIEMRHPESHNTACRKSQRCTLATSSANNPFIASCFKVVEWTWMNIRISVLDISIMMHHWFLMHDWCIMMRIIDDMHPRNDRNRHLPRKPPTSSNLPSHASEETSSTIVLLLFGTRTFAQSPPFLPVIKTLWRSSAPWWHGMTCQTAFLHTQLRESAEIALVNCFQVSMINHASLLITTTNASVKRGCLIGRAA